MYLSTIQALIKSELPYTQSKGTLGWLQFAIHPTNQPLQNATIRIAVTVPELILAHPGRAKNLSIWSFVGAEGCAPNLVTDSAAAALAKETASLIGLF